MAGEASVGVEGVLREQMQPQSQWGPLKDGENALTFPVLPLGKKGCRVLVQKMLVEETLIGASGAD